MLEVECMSKHATTCQSLRMSKHATAPLKPCRNNAPPSLSLVKESEYARNECRISDQVGGDEGYEIDERRHRRETRNQVIEHVTHYGWANRRPSQVKSSLRLINSTVSQIKYSTDESRTFPHDQGQSDRGRVAHAERLCHIPPRAIRLTCASCYMNCDTCL